jgi:hypothetical protein
MKLFPKPNQNQKIFKSEEKIKTYAERIGVPEFLR